MQAIRVEALTKTFRVRRKEKGMRGSIKAILRPQTEEIRAVHGVSFEVEEGEMLAFIGPNGAGKSTLIKIICGSIRKDEGSIRMDGKEVSISGPLDAQKLGIYSVQQHFSLIPTADVAENLFFDNFPIKGAGVIDRRKMHEEAKELLDSGHSVIYFTASSLFHIFEKNVFGRETEYSEDYRNIFDCDLLILDDLGTELSNAFTSSQLFLCLNERILRRKSTIISTNLSLSQLVDTYSERTFSRISSSYTMIKLFGNDIRLQKKLGQARQGRT